MSRRDAVLHGLNSSGLLSAGVSKQTNLHVTRPNASSNTSSHGNILDLVMTNHDDHWRNYGVSKWFVSGHFAVCFAIKKTFDRPKNSLRSVFCYDKADFDGLRHILSHILWDSFISCDDIDSSTANFPDLVLAAVNQHLPRMKLKRQFQTSLDRY